MPFHVSESFLEAIHTVTGLKVAWDMQENPIIGNIRDTAKFRDLSGNGNDATIGAGLTSVAGKHGKAARFDGSGTSLLNTGDVAGLLTKFTIGCWFTITTKNPVQATPHLMSKELDQGGGREGPDIFYNKASDFVACQLWNGGTFQQITLLTAGSPVVDRYYRVIYTYDSTLSSDRFKVYLDGGFIAASAADFGVIDTVGTSFYVGSRPTGGNRWEGDVDDPFFIDGEAWTAAQVLADFEHEGLFTIPGHKIALVSLAEADEDLLDEMDLRVYNDGGEFRDHLGMGNEVKWYMRTEGDTEALLRWTGIVKKPTLMNTGTDPQTVATLLGDYVYEILTQRQLFETFVAKDAGVALKEAVELKCPELDTTLIQSGADAIDMASDGRRVKDVAFDLARMAGWQLRGDELKRVSFFPSATDDSGLTADYTKVAEVHVGPDDTKLANVIRVEGGEGTGLIAEQTTQTTLFTVTDTTRKQVKIRTPKRKVKEIEIYTDPGAFTGDLIVRIQADDGSGTAPIAVGDQTQDLSRHQLDVSFLASAGLTTFRMPVHVLGAGNEYWIIVESDTAGGQRVGVDGSGNITYAAHFAFPIIEETEDAASIAQFGRREDHVPDPSIETKDGAKDRAKVEIARRALAERMARFEIRNPTLLAVRPGQGVVLDLPDEGISVEKFILHERRWRLKGAVARVTFNMVEQERLLGAADVIKALLSRVERVERRLLRSGGEEVPDIYLSNVDSYSYADAAVLTVDVVAGMVWDTDAWDLEVWSE